MTSLKRLGARSWRGLCMESLLHDWCLACGRQHRVHGVVLHVARQTACCDCDDSWGTWRDNYAGAFPAERPSLFKSLFVETFQRCWPEFLPVLNLNVVLHVNMMQSSNTFFFWTVILIIYLQKFSKIKIVWVNLEYQCLYALKLAVSSSVHITSTPVQKTTCIMTSTELSF